MNKRLLVAGLPLVVAFVGGAVGAPPPDSDGSLHTWYEGLKQPGTNSPCCSISDCHALDDADWRETDSGYEVRIRGAWVRVPPQRILSQRENPTGRAVACFNETTRIIYCFVRTSET
ncbi:MAG TPA: hypothetical protein VL966_17410 [Alphaproteobacteria bacterium]|nr:hypothetical protein [Alphaproteobacteria bacterium]